MTSDQAHKEMTEIKEIVMASIEALDPEDKDYAKKAEALNKLYDSAVSAYKAVLEAEVTREKLAVEAEINFDRNRIEEDANLEAARANAARETNDAWRTIVLLATGVLSAGTGVWAFLRSTRKEVDEAYLTTTEKVVAQEGLKRGFFETLFNTFRK